jgi:hypothetical protein
MAEQIVTQTAPETKPAVQATEVTKVDDIVSRVSAFKAQPKEGEATSPADAISFNVKDFEKIQDPAARKLAEDAYKSMQADYTRKTQSLASERKQMESLKAQLEDSGKFSPQKIEQLLNNPSFVQAAREYDASRKQISTSQNGSGELTDEEFSYLAPEQQKLYLSQKKMQAETQTMFSNLSNELLSMRTQKEDLDLSGRYKNYDPNVINQTYQDMMSGKLTATREHLYKAVYHDDNVKTAYQMGREDERNGIAEKRNASTQVSGITTQKIDADVPIRQKGESFQDHWKRIVESAKAKVGQR